MTIPLPAGPPGGADPGSVTMTDAVALHAVFVAINVYDVVEAGDTETELVAGETEPGAGEILRDVEPITAQDNVEDCPAMILLGVAINEVMTGAEPAEVTEICTGKVSALPPAAGMTTNELKYVPGANPLGSTATLSVIGIVLLALRIVPLGPETLMRGSGTPRVNALVPPVVL